jgi:hypothetical protein
MSVAVVVAVLAFDYYSPVASTADADTYYYLTLEPDVAVVDTACFQ